MLMLPVLSLGTPVRTIGSTLLRQTILGAGRESNILGRQEIYHQKRLLSKRDLFFVSPGFCEQGDLFILFGPNLN